ncbi:bifunctional Helicase [Babesia duncani]|uniref:ATP-dependent RNA helicase n=1 Tax=Babesia duncani TaxID=323732 RepID=A0AAD9PHZ3_9APIC|nr:bifunctional Helicase [Babesia duncani]
MQHNAITRLLKKTLSSNEIAEYTLSRCLKSFITKVKVWGSSVIELRPNLNPYIVLRNRIAFQKRFKKCRIVFRGNSIVPNGLQLAVLRPQFTKCDLFIAAPHCSGKTLAYLLPYVVRNHLDINGSITKHKTLVLVPTLDLVLLSARQAVGALRGIACVYTLFYKDVLDGVNLKALSEANILYCTPSTALKTLIKFPNAFDNLQTLILDEAQVLLKGESAGLVVRLKNLLKFGYQTIVLAPRCDAKLRQFVSRLLRVDFRIISFLPEYANVPITKQIWGPQRSSVVLDQPLKVKEYTIPNDALEARVMSEKKKILEHCKIREVYVHKNYKNYYMIYKPIELALKLYNILTLEAGKTIVFFPTVRMTQFCYIYFKHFIGIKTRFFSLHGNLSPDKRRFVIDVYNNSANGILFATDLCSHGLNLKADLIVHVGASESIDSFADRIGHTISKEKGSSLLLLHDLDCHILYEAAQMNCDVKPTELKLTRDFTPTKKWLDIPHYMASCELMYRSLLGYYCNHAMRLKYERWQVPSLVKELVSSFGCTDSMAVSKQFAARMQIVGAPGLVVEYNATKKTTLEARAALGTAITRRLIIPLDDAEWPMNINSNTQPIQDNVGSV